MTTVFQAKSFIAKKRDGGTHARDELAAFVSAAARGEIPDYQVTAWLMAVYLKGMTPEETADLTRTMIATGDSLAPASRIPLPVDKHSTGGVGDKISFLVAPLVAAAGGVVPMISGRSLGHTGGTLDKLESIRGYRTDLTPEEFLRCVHEVGVCISGQSDRMVPADRLFYALRDAASIVESIPLITASILSKKVAEGAEALVLDVKFGRGAFMQEQEQARDLARSLVKTSALLGQRVRAYLTDMNRVLGRTAGNALEIAESVRSLRDGPGQTSPDLVELTFALGAGMLELSGVSPDGPAARRAIQEVWNDGRGLDRFRMMVEHLGGDPAVIDDPSKLPRADHVVEVESVQDGCFLGLSARAVGDWITESGGGRLKKSDEIDARVGIETLVDPGARVVASQPVLRLHLRNRAPDGAELKRRAQTWIEIGEGLPRPRVVETLDP